MVLQKISSRIPQSGGADSYVPRGHGSSWMQAKPSVVPEQKLSQVVAQAEKLIASGNAGSGDLSNKYGIMRAAQGRTGAQMLALLERIAVQSAGTATDM